MNQNLNPVMFSLPGGISDNASDANNSGFDSPAGGSQPEMSAYKIPPVAWMLILLIGGYIGLRYVMED